MKTITKDFEARTAYESPSILVVEMKTATVLCGSVYGDPGSAGATGFYNEDGEDVEDY